jgi:DNA-directed RNA polymerase subunit RPC12/RpoP
MRSGFCTYSYGCVATQWKIVDFRDEGKHMKACPHCGKRLVEE